MRIFLLIFLLCYGLLKAQVKVVDKVDNEPIGFVQVYTTEGDYLGSTNEGGFLEKELLNIMKTYDCSGFTFNHVTYLEVKVDKTTFNNTEVIYLSPNVRLLNEAIVTNKRKKGFLKIRGYYRSYQFNENKLEFYSDGKIEVVYNSNLKKAPLVKRVEERFFENPLNKQSGFIINMTGPITPEIQVQPDDLSKLYTVSELTSSDKYSLKNLETNKQIGHIVSKENFIRLELQTLSRESPKIIKALGNISVIDYENEYYIFSGTTPSDLHPVNINYHKWTQNLRYKGKKDNAFSPFEAVKEIFIDSIEYIEAIPKDGFSRFTGTENNSNYTTEFWKEAEKHPFYQPLPSGVAESLKNNLKILPNKR
jgi:hypothetical protein